MRTRTQLLVLLLCALAAGTAEAVISTTDERDEAYWRSPPPEQDVYANER